MEDRIKALESARSILIESWTKAIVESDPKAWDAADNINNAIRCIDKEIVRLRQKES